MVDKSNLKEASNILDVGDVILTFNNDNLFSQFIADVTDSDWSHASIYLGNGMIAESTALGAHISPLSNYFTGKHNIAIQRHLFLTPDERAAVTKDVMKKMDKRYGYLQMVWYLFVRLIGKSENPKWQLDLEPNAMVCSEAIAEVYRDSGYDIKPNYKSAGIEPVDFWESEQFVNIWNR